MREDGGHVGLLRGWSAIRPAPGSGVKPRSSVVRPDALIARRAVRQDSGMPLVRFGVNAIAFFFLLGLAAQLLSAGGGVGPLELAVLAVLDMALLVGVNRWFARRAGGVQPT